MLLRICIDVYPLQYTFSKASQNVKAIFGRLQKWLFFENGSNIMRIVTTKQLEFTVLFNF